VVGERTTEQHEGDSTPVGGTKKTGQKRGVKRIMGKLTQKACKVKGGRCAKKGKGILTTRTTGKKRKDDPLK